MMSQLRTALRAYAVDGGSPGRLLTQLHTFLHHLQPDLYATAVIARFRPGDPTLTWAAAGHPPPVLRTPDGQVHTLDAKPGAMLGIPLRQEIHDHTAPLAPGSTLALYTDGLVERRAQGIDPGIERLARALGSFDSAELDADLEGSADRILAPCSATPNGTTTYACCCVIWPPEAPSTASVPRSSRAPRCATAAGRAWWCSTRSSAGDR